MLTKVYQYNLNVKKLYTLQKHEIEIDSLRHQLNIKLIELEKLKSYSKLVQIATRKGFREAIEINILRSK